jgi:uncharacterized protein YukE
MKTNIKNLMENLHAFNLSFKNVLSLMNRFTFLVVCTWYVMNTKGYAVSIGPLVKNVFFQSFLSSFFNAIIAELEHIGVMIMVLPMMLVATSLMECSAFIRVSATLIAAGGNIFSILHGLHRGIFLDESFRIGGLFTIFHEFKFENKVIAFKETFQAFVDQSLYSFNGSKAFPLFVKDYLDKHWISILEPIKTTPMKNIQAYAKQTLLFLETKYKETLSLPSSVPPAPTGYLSSIVFYGSIALILLGIGYFIYKWFTDDTHARITADVVKENVASSKNLTNVIDTTQASLQNLENIATTTSNVIIDTFPKIRDEFTLLHEKFNVLAQRMGVDESQIKNISMQMQHLINSAQPHPRDLETLFDQIARCTKNIDLQGETNLELVTELQSLQQHNANLQQRVHFLESRPLIDPNNNVENNNQPNLEALTQDLQRDLNTRFDLITTTLDNKFKLTQQHLESQLTSINTGIKTNSSDYSQAAILREKQNLAQSINDLQNIKKELKDQLNHIGESFQKKKDTSFQEFHEQFSSKFAHLTRLENDLNEKVDKKLQQIYSASQIDIRFEGLDSDLRSSSTNINARLDTINAAIQQRLDQMQTTLTSHASDIKFNYASEIAQTDINTTVQIQLSNIKDVLHPGELFNTQPANLEALQTQVQGDHVSLQQLQKSDQALRRDNKALHQSLADAWTLIKGLQKDIQVLKNTQEHPLD